MSIFGVLLFTGILLCYAIILLSDTIHTYISNVISKQKSPSSYLLKIQDISLQLQTEDFKQYAGYTAILFALWNFFAPDFGSIYGGVTLIGALIPVTILFLDAFIIYPRLLDFVSHQEIKQHIQTLLENISSIAGWITLIITFVHMFLYRLPLF